MRPRPRRRLGTITAVLVVGIVTTACSHQKTPAAVGVTSSPAVSSPAASPAEVSSPAMISSPAPMVSSPSPTASTSTPAMSATASLSRTPTRGPTPSPAQVPPKTAAPTPKPAPKPTPLLVQQLASVGGAHQVVIVTAANSTTDVATVQTFENSGGSWHAVFPAMAAHIGRAGFSSDKHEGDLKTPTGLYGFGTIFGQRANPGVKFPYRQADSASVWVDDVHSPYYNTWQENAALSGEHLASPGYATAYAYAIDIAYNTSPVVPGNGSAIFLHVSTGGGTAGCVSVSQPNLLLILRWLNPAQHPVIVMGPASTIRKY